MKKFFFSSSFWIILLLIINIAIRLIFVLYGYIDHDEGIALGNVKLAYSGLVPFIDYNAWNSLINDYITGISHFVTTPSIITQRLVAIIFATFVFMITVKTSSYIHKKAPLLVAFLLTFGSAYYVYQSTIPYSEQTMTLALALSVFFLFKNEVKHKNTKYAVLALFFSVFAAVIRLQAIPVPFFIYFYFLRRHYYSKFTKLKLGGLLMAFFILFYFPFFLRSWEHALYALTWPFFANKILLYVYGVSPRSFARLLIFFLDSLRDYGIFFTLLLSGLIYFRFAKKIRAISPPIVLLLAFISLFVITGLIHTPAYAAYIYPALPLLSLTAAYFLTQVLSKISYKAHIFIYSLVLLMTLALFFLFPHFKMIKTSLATISVTPHAYLAEINSYIEKNTNKEDVIIAFFIPALTNTSRNILPYLNEGTGSISIADRNFSEKFHLTNVDMLNEYIKTKKAKLIVFSEKSIHYFGKNEEEQTQILESIKQNYYLLKKFDTLPNIDGSKAKVLYIYSQKL